MKVIILAMLLVSSVHLHAQTGADVILGKWMIIPKQNLSIKVYKTGNVYAGKITWLKDKGTAKPGFLILEKLRYNADDKIWEHGTIHNPKDGSSYSAIARIKNDGTLEVHAYKGFKFLGTDKVFKRM